MATPGRQLCPSERKRVVRLWEFGTSIRTTAKELGLSRNTVRKILRSRIAK